MLDALIGARLLTAYDQPGELAVGGQQIEIVHESLLQAWPRLVRWQTQDADGAQLRHQLRQAAQLWHERGRSEDLLWSGTAYRDFTALARAILGRPDEHRGGVRRRPRLVATDAGDCAGGWRWLARLCIADVRHGRRSRPVAPRRPGASARGSRDAARRGRKAPRPGRARRRSPSYRCARLRSEEPRARGYGGRTPVGASRAAAIAPLPGSPASEGFRMPSSKHSARTASGWRRPASTG